MRIAVVGAGVAGLVAARVLSAVHDVTVFEASDWLGGHTRTVRVELGGRTWDVDTGFVVYDPGTYPAFAALLARLGVVTQASEMSFSVRCPAAGIEYGGRSLGALFAQPGNVVRPAFHRLVRDVLRFNRSAGVQAIRDDATIGAYLEAQGYSAAFRDHYLVPMVAAIWSARPTQVLAMPADWVVRFFADHGLLRIRGQPEWRTITGGASRYVDVLVAPFRDRVRTGCAVAAVRRLRDGVAVTPHGGAPEHFDHVVLAVHGSQALALLADATAAERAVLGAFHEQENEAVLHTDTSVLPASRRAWCSWNVHLDAGTDRVVMTYDMRRLQRLDAPQPLCVTLNASAAVDPARILGRFAYAHPIFTPEAVAAQRQHATISGVARTSYCGAWWGYGFHEDGVASALAVCRRLGVAAPG